MMRKIMLKAEGLEAGTINFDAVVEEFYEALYQFAFSLSGNTNDAADLTQETYRVLLLKAGQIRDPQKVKSWLFTTLYREFLKGRQHLNRFPEVELDEVANELPTITVENIERADSHLVISALEALDEKYRAPVALFYLNELSYKEIAEVLEVPIGTVMSRLARGKAILRQTLCELFSAQTVKPSAKSGGKMTGPKGCRSQDCPTSDFGPYPATNPAWTVGMY